MSSRAARHAMPPEFYDGRDTDLEGPWWSLSSDAQLARALEDQLHVELPGGHALHDTRAVAIARRQDTDDVLFELSDGRFAIVHLTWSDHAEPDPMWPNTTVYSTWGEVEEQMAWDQEAFRPA